MKCLDTDFLVAVLRGEPDAREKADQLDTEGRNATTSVNAFEVLYGSYRSHEREKNVEEARRLLTRLEILPLDLEASDRAGHIAADLSLRGMPIDFRDVLIAGIAVVTSSKLVTRNEKHFSRINALKLETW
ncbi:MAG: type II toxin-antitoxin system VapC family toxin [Nitrososphaerales archaeon]